ncbi:MAG: hypothetical protein ACJAQ4_000086 [Cryomorphaceae bacterium]|jgi:hypothetical protein
MFSPMKTFKSTFFLLIGFIISAFSYAQESTAYFRYFEIELEQSVDLEKDVKSDLFSETPFQLRSSCNSRNSIVVAVPANYPKRVPQIEEELKTSLQSVFSSDKIESLHTITALDLESFCQ